LKLIEPLLRAVRSEGYTQPTPIQIQAIPHVLAGRDLLGCAQTGTGKTAAFALPILQRLAAATRHQHHRRPHIRVLVLSPTRELASQIGESFDIYGRHTGLRQTTIFGGVGQNPQVQALYRGVDILVATPGRLLDLITQGLVRLNLLEVFVLDEADRMLDMGFIHDVRRIIALLPRQRQTLFFSATMPPDIQELADTILTNPVRVEVTPQATTVEAIEQSVYFVEKNDKPALLQHLLRDSAVTRALVFTRTKHGADRVVKQLRRTPSVGAEAIHGNKSQSARERALAGFKNGDIRVLVATDIAARGIDVESISHVINYDLPNIPETYIHRIGRTGRAGASGIAFSFCDTEERAYLIDIERLTQQHVPVVKDHPYRSSLTPPLPTDLNPQRRGAGSRPASAAPAGGTSRDKKYDPRRGGQTYPRAQSGAALPPARSQAANAKSRSNRPNRRRRWHRRDD
jgi:ATP-dependent RNA helicase RhlE